MRLLEGEIPPLQNDDWFLSSSYLKGTLRHYKMKIGFYMLLSSGYLKGKLQYYNLQNDDWKWLESMRLGFHMLPSEGQLTLLQNEIGFLHVVFRWANSLATKWLSIFKGLSTTETLKTHKMQFSSSGYKMPGPSPFVHLNLSLERPWNGAQGLPFCSWNSNGDAQTICSTFGIVILALHPFATPSSVSLLIPLQTLLFRTPTNAALRWASEFLHFPPCSPYFGRFSFIFCRFFPTFFLSFLHFPPFSPCSQRFSFIFLVFFLPFSCRSQRT